MTLTEGESKALVASALLVLLAVLGRLLLQVPAAEIELTGMGPPFDVDSALAVAESIYAEGKRRGERLAPDERIDPNRASEVELDRLPGVGPSLAHAIVVDRQAHGPFRTQSDLERVPGIGAGTARRLAPYMSLPAFSWTGPATGMAAPAGNSDARTVAQGRRTSRPRVTLDLNQATVDELITLPGVGVVRAKAIIRWREEHGEFRSLDDLVQVPGVGPATVARLRPLVEVRP